MGKSHHKRLGGDPVGHLYQLCTLTALGFAHSSSGSPKADKTLYNRWKRWGEMGVFTRMMEGLSAQRAEPQTVMIDATYLKAHRTASSLGVKKGISGV